MMEEGAFIPLKTGLAERESSKQAEVLLAGLPTILGIRLRHGREGPEVAFRGCADADFRWLWLICINLAVLLSRLQL
jgi:hypothetical protein